MSAPRGHIRIGISGWLYPGWRGALNDAKVRAI